MTKHNPFNLQAVDLPDYASVDELFPSWLTARQDLPFLIPVQMTYRIARGLDSSRTLVIDYEWLSDARDRVPSAADKAVLDLRTPRIGAAISSINALPVCLAGLTAEEAEIALDGANRELVADEEERRVMGMATRRDIIKHILGLEPAPGTLADKILRRGRG